MKYRLLVTLLCLITITSVWADTKKSKNILSLKETITDNDIRYPSSFNESNDMMKDWYNLYHETNAPIDKTNDGQYGNVSDKVYKERLQKLPTSIEMPFNQIVKSYIERYVVKGRSMVANLLGMSNYYMPIFEAALARHHMPLELKYIPIIESALNPNAVSPAGAGGLWQFMPATAKGHGMEVNNTVDQRRDPYVASEKAAIFFQKLYNTYGDWSLAIAAYNCGPGNVNKAIKRTGNDKADFWEIYNYLPKETRGYVPAFIAANYMMTYYKDHGISPQKTRAFVVDTVMVKKRVTFSQISRVLNIPIEEIRILNPQYRGDVIPGNVHPYYLALPSQHIISYIANESRIIGGSGYSNRPSNSSGTAFVSHVVKDEESIYDISDQYGITVDDILLLNNLQTAEEIRPGMQLKVINNGKKLKTTNDNPQNTQGNEEDDYDDDYDDDNGTLNNKGTLANNDNNNKRTSYYLDDDDYDTNYNGSRHNGSDGRKVPVSQRRKVDDKPEVPVQRKNNDNDNYNRNYHNNNNYYDDQDDDEEEELRRQEEEARKEAERKKKAAEEARKRKAAEEAAKKKAAEEYAKKKAAEKKAAEEAAKKRAAEKEAAKKKAAEEAAKKKAAEEAAKKKAAEEAAKRKAAEEAAKPHIHNVADGENLTKIAKRYGTTPQKIKQANGIKDDNMIRSGTKLKIPKN